MIGLGKSSIDDTVRALVTGQGRTLLPDQFPDKGSYYRSDQLNFARAGVPAAYFKPGTDVIGKPAGWGREQQERYVATDYHQPSDEIRPYWDLSGAVEDCQLIFEVGIRLADAPGMPEWKKGDEFEAARKKAIDDTAR
jgi:Zn-dependent M28 family amino/carboxypeptidase